MSTFKSHYCQEGEQRKILLGDFISFQVFERGFLQKISYFNGKE